jgi:hypothetical protein
VEAATDPTADPASVVGPVKMRFSSCGVEGAVALPDSSDFSMGAESLLLFGLEFALALTVASSPPTCRAQYGENGTALRPVPPPLLPDEVLPVPAALPLLALLLLLLLLLATLA